jgi:hypothetical protein
VRVVFVIGIYCEAVFRLEGCLAKCIIFNIISVGTNCTGPYARGVGTPHPPVDT